MGNRKFKLSEMLPNAWFFKLKEIGTKTHHHHPAKKHNLPPPPHAPPHAPPQSKPPISMPHHDSISNSRKSYHFTRDLNPKSPDLILFPPLDPPRKSSKKRRPTTTTTTKKRPSTKSSSSSSSHGEETCVVIDVDKKSLGRKTEDSVSTLLRLPPIKTERSKFDKLVGEIEASVEAIDEPIKKKQSSVEKNDSLSVKVAKEGDESMASSVFKERGTRPVRRFPTGSPRFRVRINSPRIARRPQVSSSKGSISRKSISSETLAVVKSSFDPKRDFRDSMVEMIVENNIRASKDLEELLACYLSLNSDEYHDVIIQVFKQIWFDLNNIRRVGEVVE